MRDRESLLRGKIENKTNKQKNAILEQKEKEKRKRWEN